MKIKMSAFVVARRSVCFFIVWLLAVGAPSCDWFKATDCPPLTVSAVPGGDGAGGVGGGDGLGGDDGFGGVPGAGIGVGASTGDVGVGASTAGIGVGASTADVGVGPTTADVGVGAGAGPARSPQPRSRRTRWHYHWHNQSGSTPDGPIGVAVEAICVPKLSPLTTTRLRQIANANGIGVGQTVLQQSRTVGIWFETWVLYTMQLPKNKMSFTSKLRQAKTGGLPASVIPDAVASLFLTADASPGTFAFPMSQFHEVKAVTGNMTLSTSQYQLLGLIDVTSLSPAGVSTIPQHPPAQLVFSTTGNTTIGPNVIAQANTLHVALWQQVAFEDLNTNPNNPMIYLNAAIPLNPVVYAPAVPGVSPVGWPPSTLTTPAEQLTDAPGDPDPAEVQ